VTDNADVVELYNKILSLLEYYCNIVMHTNASCGGATAARASINGTMSWAERVPICYINMHSSR